jgi:hypothetical protein
MLDQPEGLMSISRVRMAALLALPAVMACGGDDQRAIDEALKQDLWLASRTNPYAPYVSPLEQGYAAAAGYQPQAYGGGYMQAVARPAPAIQRAPTVRRAPAQSSGGETVIKNTKRDALIGAAAGAALGAVTSKDALKGAVIGGIAGGVLGGVIGNNVDIKRIPRP